MKRIAMALAVMGLCAPAFGNDWQKFYHPLQDASAAVPWAGPPEIVTGSGNLVEDVDRMWRHGYGVIGYSAFNSPNDKTADAIKWGQALKARYVMLGTSLTSSRTGVLPVTVPHDTTSTTNGMVGGTPFSATTTRSGMQTSLMPFTVNRFDKLAIYFSEVPKKGTGILPRELAQAEISALETQRALAVRAVRDGSPAYEANILPGDLIVEVNGKPADAANWQAAVKGDAVLHVRLMRNGQPRELAITVPAEWRPQ
jgi:hypothetical protein